MTRLESQTPPGKLLLLEVYRGIAAMLVVFHHIGNIIAQPKFFGDSRWQAIFGRMHLGVDLFFVLSGFVITYTHFSRLGQASTVREYLFKRTYRIFPLYLFVTFFYVSLLFTLGDASDKRRLAGHLLQSVFLLPSHTQPILGVGWTLVFELIFYAAFVVPLIFGHRWFIVFGVAWGIVVVTSELVGWRSQSAVLMHLTSPFILQFLMGAAVAVLVRRRPGRAGADTALVLGLLIFLAALMRQPIVGNDSFLGRTAVGFAASLIVFGITATAPRRSAAPPTFLIKLGAASYSLYLCHTVVLAILCNLLIRLPRFDTVYVVALLLTASVISATMLHQMIERPIMRAAPDIWDCLRLRRLTPTLQR
jgi:exopolysaccharide production protein ExoZ